MILTARHAGGCFHGHFGQCLHDITSVPGQVLSSGVGDAASSAWDEVCRSFAQACTSLLQAFAKAFAAMSGPDLAGVRHVYGISLSVGLLVAVLLLCVQAAAVTWTHSGEALAHALLGVVKAAVATGLTLTVSHELLRAADQLTTWIITADGSSVAEFSNRLTTVLLLNPDGVGAGAVGIGAAPVLLLLFGLTGVLLVVVLWVEMIIRNVAIVVLVATAPIAAAGQIGASTSEWWHKLARAVLQLAVLKPVIALIFAVGFSTTGTSSGVTGLIDGMVILFLAVFAWPVIARFFTFTTVGMGGGMGLAALVGAVANRGGGGGGVDPGVFAQSGEPHALAARAGWVGGRMPGGLAPAGESPGGALGGVVVAAQVLQRTINAVSARMEQHAGHAGIEGGFPMAYPAGYPTYGPVRLPARRPVGDDATQPLPVFDGSRDAGRGA
jgi:hypothetical protein